jgi:hypothetical protein
MSCPREESTDHTCLANHLQLNNYFLLLLICTDIMPAIDGNDYKNDRAAAPGKYMPAFSLTRARALFSPAG